MKIYLRSTIVIGVFLSILAFKNKEKKEHFNKVFDNVNTIDGFTVEQPITVDNLGVFIITGKEGIEGKSYTTLSNAMSNNKVVVNETGDVNELSIDNKSKAYIFIHSGDIVKGGKQDRTISYDVIIPPKAKKVKLKSFCVEQSRWQKRGGEAVGSFSANSKMISSRELKITTRGTGSISSQSRVWSEVSKQKKELNDKLSKKNGYDVNVSDNESNSSLQLALESKALTKAKRKMNEKLKDLINTPNALGYGYTINGEIYGVELYNNKELFKDLWPKILESLIVEAISKDGETIKEKKTTKDIITFMEGANEDDETLMKKLNSITKFKTIESKEGSIVFITEDLNQRTWIHKGYMKIDKTKASEPIIQNRGFITPRGGHR